MRSSVLHRAHSTISSYGDFMQRPTEVSNGTTSAPHGYQRGSDYLYAVKTEQSDFFSKHSRLSIHGFLRRKPEGKTIDCPLIVVNGGFGTFVESHPQLLFYTDCALYGWVAFSTKPTLSRVSLHGSALTYFPHVAILPESPGMFATPQRLSHRPGRKMLPPRVGGLDQ